MWWDTNWGSWGGAGVGTGSRQEQCFSSMYSALCGSRGRKEIRLGYAGGADAGAQGLGTWPWVGRGQLQRRGSGNSCYHLGRSTSPQPTWPLEQLEAQGLT